MKLYKYQGAGNDFLIADNRDGSVKLDADRISALCDRRYGIGADGVMLLENSDLYDFRMVYYNSDGSGGMMCGNGGRCIVAFASDMGIKHFDFEAADGFHGVDIGATNAIHEILLRERKRGAAILMISEDLDELFTMSDRIAVLFEGRITGIVDVPDKVTQADYDHIGHLMVGNVGAAAGAEGGAAE